ncbi:MAG TPA: ATP-grasp domain-containing protein [Acidimicrobiales bacterium]
MTTTSRPVLAIVYGDNSASAMALHESAAALCDIVWVVDSSEIQERSILRLLGKLGRVVDINAMTPQEASDALRSAEPSGIVAYADAQIATASALGASLGLNYHDETVAGRLLDKVVQRRAFAAAGLGVPRCVAVPSKPSPAEIEGLMASVDFPVILKPRHGAASRETHLAEDAQRLRELLIDVSSLESDTKMVVEEFMVGASPPPSSYFGDYVSVESVVAHGHISHLAVTGRLPSAKPFRETGLIIPSDYPSELVLEVLGVATDAINALGIRTGCLHTEIKVTDKGLRVIEVNGRIGGFVAPVMALACPGVDFFQISQRVALGERVVFAELLATDHVGFVIVGQPPIGARRVARVSGIDRLATYPGVSAVAVNRRPGDTVDWRLGSHEYVFSVLGAAPDSEAVRALDAFISEHVVIEYE